MCATGISKDSRIIIAGAGIGGLASALALQQCGFHPVVCERAPELREIGAGLLLSPNGVRALELLGLREKATARSRVIREWRILNGTGQCLQRMRPHHNNLPALSLHRAELQSLLVDAVSETSLRLGCEVRDFQVEPDSVQVVLASGENLQADALIGADGLKSSVRAGRLGQRVPTYSGYVGWRGVSPWIPSDYEGEHLSESWAEGKRFGISPLGNGRCYWYATATRPAAAAAGLSSEREGHRVELLRLFGHWHAPISALIEATPADNIILSDIYDRAPQHPWSDQRVTLVGDAAHPMTPNLGQGACFALEDACVIAHCVDQASDFSEAFKHYEATRRARADTVQRRSRWLGKLIQLESPALTALRNVMLRITPRLLVDVSMRELFSFKL